MAPSLRSVAALRHPPHRRKGAVGFIEHAAPGRRNYSSNHSRGVGTQKGYSSNRLGLMAAPNDYSSALSSRLAHENHCSSNPLKPVAHRNGHSSNLLRPVTHKKGYSSASPRRVAQVGVTRVLLRVGWHRWGLLECFPAVAGAWQGYSSASPATVGAWRRFCASTRRTAPLVDDADERPQPRPRRLAPRGPHRTTRATGL
jgi:hypothetical protein